MPGCAAVGCTNSAKKGFLMKTFPRDPNRRLDWAIRTQRGNWTPTNSTVLCEVHFAPEMWELTREDGKRRLKCNAVPTIFSFTEKQPTNLPNNRDALSDVSKVIINDAVTSTSKDTVMLELVDQCTTSAEVIESEHSYANLVSLPDTSSVVQPSSNLPELSSSPSSSDNPISIQIVTNEEKLVLYQNRLKRSRVLLQRYKNKLKYANFKLKHLENKIKAVEDGTVYKNEDSKILRTVFRTDQIIALKTKSKNMSTNFIKWSDETIMEALNLRTCCGRNGYDELLKLNFPLPSIRTLQRKLKSQ